MNLDQYYQSLQGQANAGKILVPGQAQEYAGQCFQWADLVIHNVYGLPYFYAPIALDFWTNPQWLLTYFDKITDGTIKKGDIVVYAANINPEGAGHVDIAAQDGTTSNYVGYDSNWDHLWLDTVNHTGHDDTLILGSLRLKSSEAPTPSPTPAPQPVEKTLTVTGSLGMNVRTSPHLSAPIYEVLPKGTIVNYVQVVQGDSVGGNSTWLLSAQGHYYWSGNTNYGK